MFLIYVRKIIPSNLLLNMKNLFACSDLEIVAQTFR